MSGLTEPQSITEIGATVAIVLLCVGASATDLWRGKIYNVLTAPALAIGLALALAGGGLAGLGHALLAVALGLVLYGWMYALRFLGAGDVKLLMALGALGGTWEFVARTAFFGVVFGGALALLVLLVRGKLPGFLRRARDFFYGLLVRELEIVPFRADQREQLPFGVPIAAAALAVRFGELTISAFAGLPAGFLGGV